MRRLSDGCFLLVNAGSSEVRLYDAEGGLLRSIGGKGEGPGEFRYLWDAWSRGDSLIAFDLTARRVTVFDSAGNAVQTYAPGSEARDRPIAVLPDGSVILQRIHAQGMTVHVREVELFHGESAVGELTAIGRFPLMKVIPIPVSERSFMMDAEIFGPRTEVAAAGEHVYVATAEEPEVEVRTLSGDVVRKVRWSVPERTVTPEDRDAYIEDRLAGVEDAADRPAARKRLEDAHWADRFPTVEGLLVDANGNVWVRPFRRPWLTGTVPWLIFDTEGALLGEVDLPGAFTPTEIGPDWVLGLATDELGVHRVRLYGLEVSSNG